MKMKRPLLILLAACLIIPLGSYSQNVLDRVGKAVVREVLEGTNNQGSSSAKADPEPSCACDDARLVVDLGGSLKLDYRETKISTMDDGSLLLQDRISGNYFIIKDGVSKGPVRPGDPLIAGFEDQDGENSDGQLLSRYKEYISKSGDKFLITFAGKSYGPFAEIKGFAVTAARDKFAAMVIENIVATEMDGKAMDEAIKNARTDQERMQLAMKFSRQMQQKMMAGGGPSSMTDKLVSNVPGASFDMMKQPGAVPNGAMKYDEILLPSYDKIYNLQGQLIMTLKGEHAGNGKIFINSSNSVYAAYNYGTILFSDGKNLTDLFNPHLVRSDGRTYLAYMYYSPKRNGLMECRIPF